MKKFIGDKLGQLSKDDLIKATFLCFLGFILKTIETGIDTNSFPATWAEWYAIIMMGLKISGVYMLKQLVTNSDGDLLKKEAPKV